MPRALRSLDPFRADLLVGAALLVELQLELALLVPGGRLRGLAAVSLAAIAAGIALRRRAPIAGVTLVFAAIGVLTELGQPYSNHLVLAFFMLFVSSYSLGAHARHGRFIPGVAFGSVLAVLMTTVDPEADPSSYVFATVVTMIGPAMIGRLLRNRTRLNRALRENTAALERHRAGEAERAAADERTRIAGELHDVVAHALSAMTVQAGGVRRLVATDTGRARAAFAAIETTGREALDELRRLLGVLRRGDERLALAPLDPTAYRALEQALAEVERGPAGAPPPPPRPGGALARRLQRLSPVVIDRIGAGALVLGGMAEVAASPVRAGSLLANFALVLLYTVPFAWRRRSPLAAVAAVLAGAIAMAWFLTPMDELLVPLLAVLLVAYSCGAYLDGRLALLGVGTIAGAMAIVVETMSSRDLAAFVFPTTFMLLAWLTGRAVRSRTRLTEELREAAARAAEAHEDDLRNAAADERRRIAREMHDLVAHSMSVMVVQAGGARRILDRDPGRARQAAQRIERTGREALAEMRHLLGVLHPADEPRALAPQPTLAELDALIARARAAGLPTTLHQRGARRPLPAGIDLAAYRIVQEALTNALKHAGGAPTEVTLDWGEYELGLEIRDHGRGGHTSDDERAAQGRCHGLVGMRERVRLYGGVLELGSAAGGGWRVHATLPLVREMAVA